MGVTRRHQPAATASHAAANFTLTSRLQAALELLRDLLPGHVVDELLYDSQSQQQLSASQQQLEEEQLDEHAWQEHVELEQQQEWEQQEHVHAAALHSGKPYGGESPFTAGPSITAGSRRAARQLSFSSRSASHTSYTSHAALRTRSESMGGEAMRQLGNVPWTSSPGGMFDEWLAGNTGADGATPCCVAGTTWPCALCRRALETAGHRSTPLPGTGSALIAAARSLAFSAPSQADQSRHTLSSYDCSSFGTSSSNAGTRTGFLNAEREADGGGGSSRCAGGGNSKGPSGTGFSESAGGSAPASAHMLCSMYPGSGEQGGEGSQPLGTHGGTGLGPLGPLWTRRRLPVTADEVAQQLLEGTEDEEEEEEDDEQDEAAPEEEEQVDKSEEGDVSLNLAPFLLGLPNQAGSAESAFEDACRLLLAPIRCSPRTAGLQHEGSAQEPGQQQPQPAYHTAVEQRAAPEEPARRAAVEGMWSGATEEPSARRVSIAPPSPPLHQVSPAHSRRVTGDGRAGGFASGASGVSGRSFMPTLNGMIMDAAGPAAGPAGSAGAGALGTAGRRIAAVFESERAGRDSASSSSIGSGSSSGGSGSGGARPAAGVPDSPPWELRCAGADGAEAGGADSADGEGADDAGMDTIDHNLRDIVSAFAATLQRAPAPALAPSPAPSHDDDLPSWLGDRSSGGDAPHALVRTSSQLSTGLRRVKTAVVDLFSLAGFAGGSSSGAALYAADMFFDAGAGAAHHGAADGLRDTRSTPLPLALPGVRGSRSSNQLRLGDAATAPYSTSPGAAASPYRTSPGVAALPYGTQSGGAQMDAVRCAGPVGGGSGSTHGSLYGSPHGADGTRRSGSGWLYGAPPGQASAAAAAAAAHHAPCHSLELPSPNGRPRHPRPSLSVRPTATSDQPLSPPPGGGSWAWWAQQSASSLPATAPGGGRSPPPPAGLMRSLVPAFMRRSMSLSTLNTVDGVAEPPEGRTASGLLRHSLASAHGGMPAAAAAARGGGYGNGTGASRPRPIAAPRLQGLGGYDEGTAQDSPPPHARLRRLPRASTSVLYGSGAPNSSCSEAGTPRAPGNGGGAAPYAGGSGFGGGLHDLPYAEWHPCVSVLFADIVGFTQISNRVPAVAVMEMLNALYCRLDVLCASWGQQQQPPQPHLCGSPPAPPPPACAPVYKVQIIGDAYMVATGLLADHPAHAATACSFALAVLREAEQVLDPCDGKPLKMRVGIHSGPVVSGVVGRMRRQYSVFGDTVNVASRMESTGAPGAIHVSEDTQRLAAPYMAAGSCVWRRREGVEVKGKGTMDTYWLEEEGTGAQEQ